MIFGLNSGGMCQKYGTQEMRLGSLAALIDPVDRSLHEELV
jgi:hypothetical protein